MKKHLLLWVGVLLVGLGYAQNNDGDFRSRQSGRWSDSTTWQIRIASLWYNAGRVPNSNDPVLIQNGHTITLDTNEEANHLYLNTSGILSCASFSLSLTGSIYSYSGSAVIADSDALITNATNPSAGNIICGSGGMLKFIGASRNITFAGRWGSNGLTTSATVVFALDPGNTGTFNSGFKAANIIIASGTIMMNSFRMAPDKGSAALGDLTIDSGACLISNSSGSSNQVFSRTTTAATGIAGNFNLYGTLRLMGISPHIAFANVNIASGSTIEYGGASQNLLNATFTGASKVNAYHHLILLGSGTKTLTTAITVNGVFSLQGNATFAIASFTLSYGNSASLEYKGNAAQTMSLNPPEWPVLNAPTNLIINNSRGVTMGANRIISGVVYFYNGLLNTAFGKMLLLDTNATTIGASDTSFVNGPLQKLGYQDFIFPIGKAGSGLHPIAISGVNAGIDTFTAEYMRSSAYQIGNVRGAYIAAIDSCEYWTLTSSNASNTSDITLYGNANSGCGSNTGSNFFTGGGASVYSLRVIQWSGSAWENASYGTTIVSGTSPDIDVKALACRGFNLFTFGSTSSNPLPVTLVSFTAQVIENKKVQLDWCTASEKDNDRFEIECSEDGSNYKTVGWVKGKSNEKDRSYYSYIDPAFDTHYSNTKYYRLKQIDHSGAYEFSNTLVVHFKTPERAAILRWHRVNNDNNILFEYAVPEKGKCRFFVNNSSGTPVKTLEVFSGVGFNSVILELNDLPPGFYFIQLIYEEAPVKPICLWLL